MASRTHLPSLLLAASLAFTACEGDPAPGPGAGGPAATLACDPAPALEALVGSEASAEVACRFEGDFTLIAIESNLPFQGAMTGGTVDGGLTVRVAYLPSDEGPHTGSITIRFGSDGKIHEHVVALTGSTTVLPPDWDPEPPFAPCSVDEAAPLLDTALAQTNLTRDTFTFDYAPAEVFPFLKDPFLLSWFEPLRAFPARAGCFEGTVAGGVDHYLRQQHTVAGLIKLAAKQVDREPEGVEPLRVALFEEALESVCRGACEGREGELPEDLARALSPVLLAIADGLEARAMMDEGLKTRDAEFWRANGGNANLGGPMFDVQQEEDRNYLLGTIGRRRLYQAAAKIAFAVEHADWSRFRDRTGIRFDLRTPAGWIRVRDGAAETYADDGQDVLLFVDLGGDDVHLDPVAANRSAANAVSVALELGGSDHYKYETMTTRYDREGLPPADAGGRAGGSYNVSYSQVSRQGGARNGIAMLFDLAGDDRYESLRASQGYAHLGVGVLYDGGGDDAYVAEMGSQGAAQWGIGLLVDVGAGTDEYRGFSDMQGYGYVGGAGFLVDDGGNDVYFCDHGDPEKGGIPLYYSPQLPGKGNSSFCQGAGFGMRAPEGGMHLSGGVGVLRDLGGDDTYTASVFAQGTGYWQGTGLLSDGGGSDTYDALWYVQGAAAHFAVGILADAGQGNDLFDTNLPTKNMSLGAGHDFSTGVLINELGNDEYRLGTLAGGASNCNGLGLIVDNGGDDRWIAASDYGSGMGNVSGECIDTRSAPVSIGVMIDAGGADTYDYPESSFTLPSEGGTWGHARNGLESEHGAGLDAEGETGVHAESGRM